MQLFLIIISSFAEISMNFVFSAQRKATQRIFVVGGGTVISHAITLKK
jgi:hypothetical protein